MKEMGEPDPVPTMPVPEGVMAYVVVVVVVFGKMGIPEKVAVESEIPVPVPSGN